MSVLPISRPSVARRLLALAAMLATPALLVTPLSLSASVRHAVAPVHRAEAHAPVSRSTRAAEPERRGAHVASRAVAAHHIPFEEQHGSASSRRHPSTEQDEPNARTGKALRPGRHEAAAHGRLIAREEDLPRLRHGSPQTRAKSSTASAARDRDSSHARGSHHGMMQTEEPVLSATNHRVTHRASRSLMDDTEAATDSAADRGTQDRVHAWYRTQDVAGNVAPVSHATAARATAAPDLSTTPQKATAEDFARAADAQRQTIRSTADQNSRQTTAADDAADAESHIPSTAPTEREPSPFVHGEPMPTANTTSRRTPAPVVRQKPDTANGSIAGLSAQTRAGGSAATLQARADDSTGSVNLSPPAVLTTPSAPAVAHVDLQHGRGNSTSPAMRPAGGTDAAVLGATPLAMAANSSSRAIRAIAAETAAAATPRVQLPSPPVAGHKPAITAIQAGAAHQVLDPAVTAGMANETFDDDDTPATASTAIRLATTGTARVRSHATPDPDDDTASTRVVVPVNLFDGGGHLLLLPPMKGTHEILVHQNRMALADGLERIQNDSQLAEMRRTKLLVALPDDDSLYPNDALPLNRRYARPWTVRFLRDLARAHYTRFGTPLIVTSAARTVEFQRRLVRVNGNAAPPTGDIASPHLYGQAIDLAKHGMSLTEITWMRAYLAPVEDEGKIDVEEEFQQACFHISVYRRYLGAPPQRKVAPAPPVLLQAKTTPAPENKQHRLPTALLATHLP